MFDTLTKPFEAQIFEDIVNFPFKLCTLSKNIFVEVFNFKVCVHIIHKSTLGSKFENNGIIETTRAKLHQ